MKHRKSAFGIHRKRFFAVIIVSLQYSDRILVMEVVDNASDENNENTRRKATVVPIKIEYV